MWSSNPDSKHQDSESVAMTARDSNSMSDLPEVLDSEGSIRNGTSTKNKSQRRPTLPKRRSHNTMEYNTSPEQSPARHKKTQVNPLEANISLPTETLKRIDYVIVHPKPSVEDAGSKKDREKVAIRRQLRERFEESLTEQSIEIQREEIGDNIFMKIHVPFKRLCKEAQHIKLEMPLEGCEIYEDDKDCCSCWHNLEQKYLCTDDEVDFVSAAYQMDKHFVFENHDDADRFFRPALRCFLANHILINTDIRKISNNKVDPDEEDPLAKKGLPYLLHKKVYLDAFVLHDETSDDPQEHDEKKELKAIHGDMVDIEDPDEVNTDDLVMPDTRRELMNTWGKLCPQLYQPFWKIRNYFGEKIALYFAWVGVLITTLWIPTFFGLAVFLYGLYLSASAKYIENNAPSNSSGNGLLDQVTDLVDDSLGVIKQAFDNAITPYYALVMCLWGTIFLEVWKRQNATLSYEWDVDDFEDNEVDRPQFVGTKVKPDPIILGEETWYYPMTRQFMKFFASFSFLIMMIIVVFIAAGSVILYRVFMTIEYCDSMSSVGCLCITTIASSVLNAVAILLLGRVYDFIAVKLTDWENHRTQTQYDDALILKLFAFQFANSYTSCFYIAFLRGIEPADGLFGLGPEYQDTCGSDGNCMAMLSFQVLILMLMKPFPKLLKDIILPWLRKKWRHRKFCRAERNKVGTEGGKMQMKEYLERERLKPPPGDVTLGEYTEKVLVYGFLMLFAASFPLAPLIALLIALIDIRVDARRLLWMYRRPVSAIAQDIGMWYGILQFLNFVGVISNAFLIAFTSSWGAKYDLTGKLIIVIGFEHIVLIVKWVISMCVPDIPKDIQRNMKREKYQVNRIMEQASQQNMKNHLSMVMTGRAKLPKLGKEKTIPEEEDSHSDHIVHDDERGLLPRKGKKKASKKQSDTVPLSAEEVSNADSGHCVERPAPPTGDDIDYSDPYPKPPLTKKKSFLPPLGNVPNLSYGAAGDTFIGKEDKFPGLQPKSPRIIDDESIA